MALLNYANTFEEIKDRLNENSDKKLELIFTADGHLVTHGRDYLALATNKNPGFIPSLSSNIKDFFRGSGIWASIDILRDLPMADSKISATNNNLFSAKLVLDYIKDGFSANDAMRYKGTITKTASGYLIHTSDGPSSHFPKICEVGDTYRVTNSGTFAGQICSPGDLLICIKDGKGDALNTSEYWTAVESNLNAGVNHNINGLSYLVYSNQVDTFTIFAPNVKGPKNHILVGSDTNIPIWQDPNKIIIGEANKVSKVLKAGSGLSLWQNNILANSYNGNIETTLNLNAATNSTIGGVIIDKNNVDKSITLDEDGNIYITSTNILNILGYVPGDPKNTYIYNIILGSKNNSTIGSSTAITNPYLNLIAKLGENKSVFSAIKFTGTGHASIITKGTNELVIKSTWRPILLGTESIGENDSISLNPSNNVHLLVDNSTTDMLKISFNLNWFNISTGKPEI